MNSESDTQGNKANQGVLDSSAILAWLLSESGGEVVEAALPSLVSAVNLTEVVYTAVRRGLSVQEVQPAIAELPLLTEVGVDEILPWSAHRSIAKWDGEKIVKGRERWEARRSRRWTTSIMNLPKA